MNENSKQDELLIILGVIPIIALTDSALNALAIGIITLIALFLSGIFFLMFAQYLDRYIRTVILIIITATIATITGQILQLHNIPLYKNLGLFLSVMAINPFIHYHFRNYNYENFHWRSLIAGLRQCFAVMAFLLMVSIIREISGKGTFFNQPVFTPDPEARPVLFANAPTGALLTTAIILIMLGLFKRQNNE